MTDKSTQPHAIDQAARQAAITIIENDWSGDIPSYAAALVDTVLTSYFSVLPQTAPTKETQTVCERCDGRREIGGFDRGDNAYRTEPCPDCTSPSPPPSAGVDAVAVKALEWTDRSDDEFAIRWEGRSPAGPVYIAKAIRRNDMILCAGRYHSSVEAAKAAAQADFDQRIRSALTPAPTPVEGFVSIKTNGTTRTIPVDEPVFLIRGQDVIGGAAVRAWADMAERVGGDPAILKAAREHAAKMEAWPKKKVADLPEKENGR